MGCGFDENLQQGASYFQRCKYFARMRVIAENFAAKLPPSPQLTVLEYQSSKAHDARTSSLQITEPVHIQNTPLGKKVSTFPTWIFNS
jgi:hypothetical protein